MRLDYVVTVISFCAEFTNPFASSIPIAALCLGDLNQEQRMAVLVMVPWDFGQMRVSPLTQELLTSADEAIKSQVDRLMLFKPQLDLDTFVKDLHHGFRNSLHVSRILELQSLELQITEMPDLQLHSQMKMLSASLGVLGEAFALVDLDKLPFLTPESFPPAMNLLQDERLTSQRQRSPKSHLASQGQLYPNQAWSPGVRDSSFQRAADS